MTEAQRKALNFIAQTMIDIDLAFLADSIEDYTRQIICLLVEKMTDHDIFVDYHISRIVLELAALLAIDDLSEDTRFPIVAAFNAANGLLSDAAKK